MRWKYKERSKKIGSNDRKVYSENYNSLLVQNDKYAHKST